MSSGQSFINRKYPVACRIMTFVLSVSAFLFALQIGLLIKNDGPTHRLGFHYTALMAMLTISAALTKISGRKRFALAVFCASAPIVVVGIAWCDVLLGKTPGILIVLPLEIPLLASIIRRSAKTPR